MNRPKLKHFVLGYATLSSSSNYSKGGGDSSWGSKGNGKGSHQKGGHHQHQNGKGGKVVGFSRPAVQPSSISGSLNPHAPAWSGGNSQPVAEPPTAVSAVVERENANRTVREDGVIEFSCKLTVDEDLGAGIDIEPHDFGFLVNDVDDEPGQDFQIGDFIAKICGVSLENNAEDEVFGKHFGNGAELLIHRYPKK